MSSIGTTTYGFDLNGNQRTEKRAGSPTRLFNWDEEDRLSSVEHDGDVTSFLYDAGGTRTHKSGASGTTVYPNAFVSIRNGVAVTRRVYADGQRVSSVLSGDDKERVYWTHGDHQGSTQYTTAQDGAVHEHYEHLPFGESWVEQTSGSDPSAHRFRGRELDQETGLQYVGARYYDPRTTRWLSTDPALLEYMLGDGMGDPRHLSTYAYVFNSPGNYVDPDGRQAVPAQGRAGSPDAGADGRIPGEPLRPDGGSLPRPESGWPTQLPDGGDSGPGTVVTMPNERYPVSSDMVQPSAGRRSTSAQGMSQPPQGIQAPTLPATRLGPRLEVPIAIINLSQSPVSRRTMENLFQPVGMYFENRINVALHVRSVANPSAAQSREITGGQQLRPAASMSREHPFIQQLQRWNAAIDRRIGRIRGIRVLIVDDWDRTEVGQAIAMGVHRAVAHVGTLILRRGQSSWSTNTLEHEIGHVFFGNYHAQGPTARTNVMSGSLPNGREVTGEQQIEGRQEAARILAGRR